jgi:DNA-binding transcriptional LysR family regulator
VGRAEDELGFQNRKGVLVPLSRADIGDLAYFVAIARHRNFRRAATDLEVSPSALSHAVSGLEARLGIRLFNRTTRSVTLTAAGEELLATIEAPFDLIDRATENLNRYRDKPTGRVRINILEDAAELLLAPVMSTFVDRYPDVEIDISVNNRLIDIIGSGFDAGIRWGGTVPEDMIAQRLSPDVRWLAAAAPAYIAKFGAPVHPDDLQHHRCIRIRLGNDQIYQWEFERNGQAISVVTPGHVTVDESHASLSLGLRGVGVMYGAEPVLRPHIESGALKVVMDDWVSTGAGFHVYYSSRRHVPTGLRLLVDLFRELSPMG